MRINNSNKISTQRKLRLPGRRFLQQRGHSFRCAFSGLWDMLLTETNAWIHAGMTVMILLVSWWLQISRQDFGLIMIAIVSVWVAEAFNTVLEIMMDYVTSKQYSPMVGRAKDISAAAVLITSLGAAIIGLSVLGPPLFEKIVG